MQVNGIDIRLHRIHTQDVISTGHRLFVAKDTDTGANKIRRIPITEQFRQFRVPRRGQTLHFILGVTDTTSFKLIESRPQRTRIGLPIFAANAQHIAPVAVDVVLRVRETSNFVALVLGRPSRRQSVIAKE